MTREKTTQVTSSALLVWLIGPAFLLAVFGSVLFGRNRTLASGLVALGFTAVFVSGIANAVVSYQVSHIQATVSQRAHAGFSIVLLHGGLWNLVSWCGPIGLWVASLSLLWHMFETRGVASPDNRWRRP